MPATTESLTDEQPATIQPEQNTDTSAKALTEAPFQDSENQKSPQEIEVDSWLGKRTVTVPETFRDLSEDQLFPGTYVEPQDAGDLNILIKKVQSRSSEEEILMSSDRWWKERLERRYYPVSWKSRGEYIEAKKELITQVEGLHRSLSGLEESHPEGLAQSYGELLENQVWPNFRTAMINEMFSDSFDGRSEGSHVHFMNEMLIPTLQSLEHACKTATHEQKKEALDVLLSFAKEHFNTDHPATNTFRYELLVTGINILGTEALPYVNSSFNDLFGKIQESEERFQRIMQDELGLSRGTEVTWAFNTETGELGYFDKKTLSDKILAIGPQTDEEFFTPNELEFGFHEHLLLHKDVVHFLGKYVGEHPEATDEVVGFLCDFMKYNSQGTLNDYVEVLQDISVDRTYTHLLKTLKSEDVLKRRMSAEILYRLEVGKIGITSKEGVSYFNKVYRLIKENDPDFFVRLYRDGDAYVQRVDSQGSIGVFNGSASLLGFFKLDLEADEVAVDALVHEISSKEVFLPKADEKPDERKAREAFLELFLAGYGKLFEQINNETGIKLNSLDLHEQGWFVVYYSQASETQKEHLKEYVRKYGELGLKVFLSLDYGESGDAILRYTENSRSSEEQQHDVMLHFYKIANRAFDWRKVFEKAEIGLPYKFSSEVHEALIRKCSEYFRAALLIETGQGREVTMKDLIDSMKSVSYALDVLKGLYEENSALVLEGNPQVQAEYADKEGRALIEDARATWTILDKETGSRVVISVRPQQTVAVGNRPGGEARINFKITNKAKGIETRIGVDLSDYGENVGVPGKEPAISLDLGTGLPDREAKIYPSQRVGRVLELVQGSEGGHNEASFSTETAKNFKAIAHKFVDYMEDRFESPVGRVENGS